MECVNKQVLAAVREYCGANSGARLQVTLRDVALLRSSNDQGTYIVFVKCVWLIYVVHFSARNFGLSECSECIVK